MEALEDSPVVLLNGPRQCGKTTLAQLIGTREHLLSGEDRQNRSAIPNYGYLSFDETIPRESAREDPVGFMAGLPERVILDEIQRAPELFRLIKLDVDRNRIPGRFLLTGSTSVSLLSELSEALVGRLQIVRLHLLSQCELKAENSDGVAESGFLAALFDKGFLGFKNERLGTRLSEAIVAGGFPLALARPTANRRANWYVNYVNYVDQMILRDARVFGSVGSIEAIPNLLRSAASQTAHLYNLSDLASPFELSRPTIGSYVALLEKLFLFERIPAWHGNRLKRLIKAPKLFLTDTGIAAALLGIDSESLRSDRMLYGQLLETFVFQELRRQASWQEDQNSFFHFRDKDGVEVDIVLEKRSGTVAGVEVKASGTVRSGDFRGLRKLRNSLGARFVNGVVLYDGETCTSFGDRLYAVPISRLWSVN